MKPNNLLLIILSLVLVFLVQACATTAAPMQNLPTASPTRDLGPERTANARAENEAAAQASQVAAALATENAVATSCAKATEAQAAADAAQATAEVQAEAEAQAAATAAQQTQTVFNARATSTQAKVEKITATAEAVSMATAQAQPKYSLAQTLFADGVIDTPEGTYYSAGNFSESWAQINYYDFWLVEPAGLRESPENFVLRADFAWSAASKNTNWDRSGCGFAVVDPETHKHHIVYLAMDGYATMAYNDGKGKAYFKARQPTDAKGVPEGEAEFVLAIQGQKISVYVNGEEAFSYTDTLYRPGVLVYTLISGTNEDYGTRCTMTGVDLWVLEAVE